MKFSFKKIDFLTEVSQGYQGCNTEENEMPRHRESLIIYYECKSMNRKWVHNYKETKQCVQLKD